MATMRATMKLHASGDKWKPIRPHHHAKGASPSGPRPSGGATVPTAVAFIHIPKNAGSTIDIGDTEENDVDEDRERKVRAKAAARAGSEWKLVVTY